MGKFTPDTAKKAGAVSKRNGRSIKQVAWGKLSARIIGEETDKVGKILTHWYEEGDYDRYMDNYMKLLVYFKPKLQAHAIKQQTEIKVTIGGEDQVLFEDI